MFVSGLARLAGNTSVASAAMAFSPVTVVFWLLVSIATEGPASSKVAATDSASHAVWRKVTSLLGRGLLAVWGWAIALNLGLLLVLAFLITVILGAEALTHIPQEFGGAKPKCGVVDLVAEQLSPELRTLLVGSNLPINPMSKVLRSKVLDV